MMTTLVTGRVCQHNNDNGPESAAHPLLLLAQLQALLLKRLFEAVRACRAGEKCYSWRLCTCQLCCMHSECYMWHVRCLQGCVQMLCLTVASKQPVSVCAGVLGWPCQQQLAILRPSGTGCSVSRTHSWLQTWQQDYWSHRQQLVPLPVQTQQQGLAAAAVTAILVAVCRGCVTSGLPGTKCT